MGRIASRLSLATPRHDAGAHRDDRRLPVSPLAHRTILVETTGVGMAQPSSEGQVPTAGPLVDTFGRIADDLRVSVTDKCNFRCTYCMPAEGLPWLPKAEILTFEEIARLLGLFVSLGVRGIKLTGGEPTVRHNFVDLV